MKALLFILLLASLALNAAFLVGCKSVTAKPVTAPAAFYELLDKNRAGILEESRDLFDSQQVFLKSLKGKTVIVVEPGELEGHSTVILHIQP